MRVLYALALVGSVLVAGGCASKAKTDDGVQDSGPRDRNVLTGEEMERGAGDGVDVYQAIAKLRPHFLRERTMSINSRGKTIAVFVGNTPYGSVETLKSLRPSAVRQVRYLSGSEATTLFGTGYAEGALILTLK